MLNCHSWFSRNSNYTETEIAVVEGFYGAAVTIFIPDRIQRIGAEQFYSIIVGWL
ncbi:hypothetical protein SUBVAR_06863 [Subdoligranulum variabile DSM 15176]|uniref:Uncharacterized protein n=1 Tax=Subdoligranulum variabile DSM 15176 TaxID=411471 RepID=D1PR35_9FIRM|nr:hypothetical protein SUBVAR_06863 [Subdoligranulum variabile DSM 15176]